MSDLDFCIYQPTLWSMTSSWPQISTNYLSGFFFCFFPTCQVRVVRFYVSLVLRLLLLLPSSSSVSPSVSSCDDVWSVWRAGPQPRAYEARVACRTSTESIWGQGCVPDLNRDPVRPVWRAGPQPRSCEFSVACRTSNAILWVQCGVPDLNRDHVSSVWRAGPQPRSCEFSVACRTSTAIMWVQCGVPDLNRDHASSVCNHKGPFYGWKLWWILNFMIESNNKNILVNRWGCCWVVFVPILSIPGHTHPRLSQVAPNFHL